jgi:hypothetical protein
MVELLLTKEQKRRVWSHVLPRRHRVEEAAFLFAKETANGDRLQLRCVDFWLLQPDDFSYQSDCHIELADATRGKVIKRAHDLGAVVVEIHSHLGPQPAQFSGSDLSGFEEWVPHVRWRLKGRPYAALVVTRRDFDGFVWRGDAVERLGGLVVGRSGSTTPNGRTWMAWSILSEDRYE